MHSAVIGVLILGGLTAAGQSASKFEVASVKPSAGRGKQTTTTSPVSLTLRNASLADCMKWAYGVMDYQISANGAWMTADRYDISAKAPQAASQAELKGMLQSLLAERFELEFHREKRDMQVLTMTVAKGGPKFHESAGQGESSLDTSNDVAIGRHASMAELAALATGGVQAPVVDLTGLTGRYDFTIDPKPYLPVDGKAPAGPVDRASILIAAFQDQLGLKIESKKIPVDVLVIDHAEKPSEN